MTQHILPANDIKEHVEKTDCPCQPSFIIENNQMIVVHNAFDGREGVEIANEILKSPRKHSSEKVNAIRSSIPKQQRLANYINAVLIEKGISKTEFSKMLNGSCPLVTKYLSGKHNFTIKTLIKIEEILGIKLLNI